jgi:hypothetical protein
LVVVAVIKPMAVIPSLAPLLQQAAVLAPHYPAVYLTALMEDRAAVALVAVVRVAREIRHL